jgi:hypothetical protein
MLTSRGEDCGWNKRKEGGGYGQNYHLPPLDTNRTEERGPVRGRLWLVRPAALPGTAVAGSGGNREIGGRGQLVLVLTLGWDGLWKEIDDGGRTVGRCRTGGGGGSSGEREGSDWEVWGEAESGTGYL